MSDEKNWGNANYANAAIGIGQWPPASPPKIERKPLVEELRMQRDVASKEYAVHSFATTRLGKLIDDLDKAIAALTPEPVKFDDEKLLDEVLHDHGERSPDQPQSQESAEVTPRLALFLELVGAKKWEGANHAPVPSGFHVEVLYRDGQERSGIAEDYAWWHDDDSDTDIIAYRIIEEPAKAERPPEPEAPTDQARVDQTIINSPNQEGEEGLHDPEPEPIATEVRKEAEGDAAQNWGPGINYIRECTCHPDDYPPSPCQHKYALSECREAATKAGMREYEMEDGSRLWAYVVRDFSVGVGTPVEASETQSELGSQSEPLASTEQEQKDESTPVLDALPPSIPRSEIPEGAAVETFTDTGVETVKIGGLTHIVEQAPEPIQNGDASVFAHGIIREADEPEARRFDLSRLFGGKAKVDA